ncbi:MAG: UDP-N-acetylmuramoyl-L-alanyl-D-glutamate--2,6-diaminopimelate ligase [Bacteroidota bacterium]|nr:UDP-N-acetylmuramoyl-L-alanyl-D-glutamate--2,6-diaminopimelate ligase [Bacteroidota bacterium]
MTWKEAVRRLAAHDLVRAQSAAEGPSVITQVTHDSRRIKPGGCFVAVRGRHTDGHQYVASALSQGAAAVVCERPDLQVPDPVPHVLVRNGRRALAQLSAALQNDPGEELHMTGITGTNGKTTTGTLVHHVLRQTGTTAGLLGTVAYTTGIDSRSATLTTPEAPMLQYLLREMVSGGCTACVMEVSSHALSQHRVDAVRFDVAVFTNLMDDHLDYHGTKGRYFQAKKRLFDTLDSKAVAIYNIDDAAGKRIVTDTSARRCSYGQDADAQVRFTLIEDSLKGLRMKLDGARYSFRLAGTFNAYNLAAAYAAARAAGLSRAPVLEALAEAPLPAGRFEQFHCADGTTVVLDFAHTPDALEQVLDALRRSRGDDVMLWCVFGCGGDRDKAKRPAMGAIAERLADRVIVTSDNPRSEDPDRITQDILGGMRRPEAVHCISDRRHAIDHAATGCAAGDIVLVAGKGHESTQTIGEAVVPLSDREEIFRAFAHRGLTEAD